jgi:hypothetical protein
MRPLSFLRIAFLSALMVPLPAEVAWSWTPPLGIPAPAWPSDLDEKRPDLPAPWNTNRAGLYFVEHGGINSGNGYPNNPRGSLPASPQPGSLVVINGQITQPVTIRFGGTAQSPIWIMGYNPSKRPVLSNECGVSGHHLIFDNLDFNASNLNGANLIDTGDSNLYRDCSFKNTYVGSNGAGIGAGGTNLIFYRIAVFDQGNWKYNGPDIDRHGIKVFAGSDQWIVDSQFYHCQGDGIQVGDARNRSDAINRIYIGRNIAYENLQTGFWAKNASDVVFSQNTIWGIKGGGQGGLGVGLGGQYDPKRVWFLSNKVYSSQSGIYISGPSDGGGGPWYVIGNIIYDIETGDCNAYDGGAIGYRNQGGLFVFFNTVHDSNIYLSIVPNAAFPVRNNIFSSPKATSCPNFNAQTYPSMDYNAYSSPQFSFGFCGGPSCSGAIKYASVDQFALGQGQERHRKVGPLGLVNPPIDFSLAPNSVCADAANPVEESVFADYRTRYGGDIRTDGTGKERNPRPPRSIGAFESARGNSP